MAIIIGKNSDNNLVGTNKDDFILGLGGDDTLSGGNGSDKLFGGNGDDSIAGGAGKDWIVGGKGNDSIDGGTGNDTIYGGDGNDSISGGSGDDVIYGDDRSGGRDHDDHDDDCHDDHEFKLAWSWDGRDDDHDDDRHHDHDANRNDTIYGGDGNDWIDGGKGSDRIFGDGGNDKIYGGSGNDSLIGGSGADELTGGSGQDHFIYLLASDSAMTGGWDRIFDFTQGQDKIDFAAFRGANDLIWKGEDPAVPGPWEVWYHNDTTSTFVYADTSGDGIADVKIELKNSPGLNLLVTDFLGVSGAPVNENVVGTADADLIVTGGGNDTIDGGAGNDVINAGAGNDKITPGSGDDTVTGGPGADSFFHHGAGDGLDTLLDFNRFEDIGTIYLTGAAGEYTYDPATKALTHAVGGYGVVFGGTSTAPDQVPFDGTETYFSATGDATSPRLGELHSTNAADVAGTVDNDLLLLFGTANGLTASGGDGDDRVLDLSAGGNALAGDGGNDTIDGAAGNDTLKGGAGADNLVGGADTDTLLYDDSPTRVIVNMFGTTTITIGGVSVAPGTASDGFGSTDTVSGFENVIGSAFNDYIQGTSNIAQRLEGGAGNDTLTGSGVTDSVAGAMDDTLLGGAGDDVLRQTRGHDTIDGGDGFNRLEFTIPTGESTTGVPYGGAIGVNVNLATGTSDADPNDGDPVNGAGGDVAIISGIEHVRGTAGNDSLTGDDFANRLEGQGGNDTIKGGAGQDSVDGGLGNDTIVMLVTTGDVDVADGGADTDTLALSGVVPDTGVVVANLGLPDQVVSIGGVADGLIQNNFENLDASGLGSSINVTGDAGANSIIGSNGNDTIDGLGGNDTIKGGAGADSLVGGTDTDTLLYDDSPNRVIVNMFNMSQIIIGPDTVNPNSVLDGFGTFDAISGFENVIGSAFNDSIQGASNVVNRLEGGAGNDTLAGSGMTDSIPGAMDDTLLGGLGNDVLRQTRGNDSIDGGADFDRLEFVNNGIAYGGFVGVNVNLGLGTSDADPNNGDAVNIPLENGRSDIATVSGIEYVLGTAGNDSLTGDALANRLEGQGGNDTLNGGDTSDTSNDTLVGGAGNDSLRQTRGNDSIDGGDGFDSLSFFTGIAYVGATGVNVNLALGTSDADPFNSPGVNAATISSIEFVTGNFGNDVFTGGDPLHAPGFASGQTEFFQPLAGNDTITGMAGRGWTAGVDYSSNAISQPVTVVLGNSNTIGTASDGFDSDSLTPGVQPYTDTLNDVEFVRGGAGNDSLVGGSYGQGASGAFVEGFRGNAGDDTIDGGGSDTVIGAYGVTDRAEYNNSPFAVVVNIGVTPISGTPYGTVNGGTARDGFSSTGGGTDTLIDINTLRGSNLNDTLIGGNPKFDNNERFEGLAGSDFIDGGSGNDEADYSSSTAPVLVNLGTGTALDGFDSDLATPGVQPYTDTLVNIERARGSDFDDTLIGGANALESFTGGHGNDFIDGGSMTGVNYASFILGTSGANASIADGAGTASDDGQGGTDTLVNINGLWGSNFDDMLTGGLGDQWFRGGGGSDAIDGGADTDTASYAADPNGVTVNLGTNSATDGWGGIWNLQGTDTLLNIENVEGSSFNDNITGNTGANLLDGRAGNDTIEGGAGDDTIDGGAGSGDLISFADATGGIGIEFTLFQNSSLTPFSAPGLGTDNYRNIEGVIGTNFNDTLTGSDGNDVIQGGAGLDTVNGSAGDDQITMLVTAGNVDEADGGTDTDTLVLSGVVPEVLPGNHTVVVDLSFADDQVLSIGGGGDALQQKNFENLDASELGSSVNATGSDGDNNIVGSNGNDILSGGGGNDTFRGGAGDDSIDGGAGSDRLDYSDATAGINFTVNQGTNLGGFWSTGVLPGLGTDSYMNIEGVFGTNFADTLTGSGLNDILRGGGGNDSIFGGNGFDVIRGGEGNDTIDGGGGGDNISFSDSTTAGVGINFTLVRGSLDTVVDLTSIGLGTDTYRNIEGVIGTNFTDTLTGSSLNDSLDGGGVTDTGDDTLFGGLGDDTLGQTKGSDSISGGSGFDTLLFNDGVSGGVNVDLEFHTSTHGTNVATLSAIEFVVGTSGNDVFTGGDPLHAPGFESGQTEFFQPQGGNDTITGKAGRGWSAAVDYSTSAAPVTVVLGNSNNIGTASDGFGGNDTLSEIDYVRGGAGDDSLVGGSYNQGAGGSFVEQFRGNAGNDTIDGGGSDTVIGAHGVTDRAEYTNSPFAVVVNLGGPLDTISGDYYGTGVIVVNGGTALDGFDSFPGGSVQPYTDTLIDIETLRGSSHNDTLVGGNADFDNNQRFEGLAGDDFINGGGGNDEADYSTSPFAVVVNLGADTISGNYYGTGVITVNGGTALDGFDSVPGGGVQPYTDTLVSMEWARGGDFNDTLVGGANVLERLMGGIGNDFIDGGSMTGVNYAAYQIAGTAVNATISNGSGTAVNDGQGGTDTLVNINGLWGSNYDDTLTGGLGDQWFRGNGGSDTIDGGADTDTVSYASDPNGVIVNLSGAPVVVGSETVEGGTARDGWGDIWGMQGTDSLTDIENVDGSDFDDTLIGNDGDNVINGKGGSDSLVGGAGNDTYRIVPEELSGTDAVRINDASGTDHLVAVTNGAGVEDVVPVFFERIGDDLVIAGGAVTVQGHYSGQAVEDIQFEGGASAYGYALGTGTYDLGIDNLSPLVGTSGQDAIASSSAAEILNGADGNDLLFGNVGDDTLNGGDGNDFLVGGADLDSVDGGAGDDTIVMLVTAGNVDEADGGTDTDTLVLSGVVPEVLPGDHTVVVDFSFTDQVLSIGGGGDALQQKNFENLDASGLGLGSSVNATGDAGANAIIGSNGNDTIKGGDGDDTITGGVGKDLLTGGAGNDTFDFNATSESGVGSSNRDVITDFGGAGIAGGDLIDLASIDASTGSGGDQSFTIVGAVSTGFGQLVLDAATIPGSTILRGYTNGDLNADFEIEVASVTGLTQGDDFIL